MAKALAAQVACLRLLQALSPAAPRAVADSLLHIQRQLQGRPVHPQVLTSLCLRLLHLLHRPILGRLCHA